MERILIVIRYMDEARDLEGVLDLDESLHHVTNDVLFQ